MIDDTIKSQYSRLAMDYTRFIKADNNRMQQSLASVAALRDQYSKILQQLPYTPINTNALLDPSIKRAMSAATASSMDIRALTKGLTNSDLFKVSNPMASLRKQLATVTATSKALEGIVPSALHINTSGISEIARQASALSNLNKLITPIVSAQAMYADQIKSIQRLAGTLPSQNVLNQIAKNDAPDMEDIDSDWFDTFPTESNHPIHVNRLKHKVYYRAKLKTAQAPMNPIEHSDSTPKSKTVNRNDLISIIDRVNNLPIVKIIELTSGISYVMTLFGLDPVFINECCRNIVFVLSMIYYGDQDNK